MKTGARGAAGDEDRVRIRLLLFGAFREFAEGAELTLDVPRGTTVAGLRGHLKEALARSRPTQDVGELVESSALASATGILAESHAFAGDADDAPVCLLPPVCGG
jgi:molybdopterin converting factor small subunit